MKQNRLLPFFICLLISLVLTVSSSTVSAQYNNSKDSTTVNPNKQQNTKSAEREAKKQKKLKEGKLMVTPLIGPAYTPELKFLIGGGGLMSWRTDKSDTTLQRSNMPIMLSYTSTGAVTLNMRPTTFWNGDKLRINGNLWFKNMPDNYWGVGYYNNYNTEASDTTTEYDRKWFQLTAEVLRKFKPNFYAGVGIDINYTHGSDESYGVESDPYYKEYNDRPFSAGLGLIARYDSRDFPSNAREGIYLNGQINGYTNLLGSDNTYSLALLDYRQYQRLAHKDGRILAWQFYSRNTFGNVPYGELSQLGSPFDLRGYPWGRYRNKGMTYGIVEYRHTFYKRSGELSKQGLVAWIASGMIYNTDGDELIDSNDENRLVPNFGIGYRLEVQPRLNLRLDFGIGTDGVKGFYFNINEAF